MQSRPTERIRLAKLATRARLLSLSHPLSISPPWGIQDIQLSSATGQKETPLEVKQAALSEITQLIEPISYRIRRRILFFCETRATLLARSALRCFPSISIRITLALRFTDARDDKARFPVH